MTRDATLTVRLARPEDGDSLLEWRNDEETRRMSRQSNVINPADHLSWYARALADPGRLILIGEQNGERIGMVRFDRGNAAYEVSIMIAPAHRGRGLGKALLAATLAKARASGPTLPYSATVREENQPSIKLFTSLGFQPVSRDGDMITYMLNSGDDSGAEET